MSYRAFKHLIGETSLERKCRYLFGGFILALISLSFYLYLRQTEHLAYLQLATSSRLLVPALVAEQHHPEPDEKKAAAVERAMADVRSYWDVKAFSKPGNAYERRFIKPDDPEKKPQDGAGYQRLLQFQNDPAADDYNEQALSQGKNHYYAAIRASESCVGCHHNAKGGELNRGDLIAVLKIEMTTGEIEDAVQRNRAWLLTTGVITAFLIMGGSYIIVRYVIVKPVKHLKEVSDAISAGELNVRSEIQTGDEFEDLSHAFNRMLRNLVSMQDRLRKVNADLDRKVDELAQANMALYESNRLKGDFLATMSHELRTPLNSILGFSEVLVSSNGLTEKQQRWVRNIQSSGERLLNLINDILDLAKIEAGKMQVRLSEFSASDVCEGLLAMFRPLAEKKNIELRHQLDQGIPLLRQDVVKLQQLLSNLLSNAIKFTPEGGRVLLRAEADPLCIVLTVTDTGVGIAPEEQELVFEKFRQSGNPMTREHAGTGLGLSIVRELSKLLGGEVTLQSELGRGSTFTVRLPLQLSEEPRLEFDLAHEGIDLSKAQRVDVRLYAGATAPATRLDGPADTKVEGK
ncbi:MAG TPA: HAMP domain-containing sensor histidine kinase [Gemmataceae bacterium]|nr:HAMP domain-containing sensor histidine kinase [Gemmataceae bacterium]